MRKKTETCDSARFPQNSSTTESKSTHNDHWTEINKSQIRVDLEEKLNESALEKMKFQCFLHPLRLQVT